MGPTSSGCASWSSASHSSWFAHLMRRSRTAACVFMPSALCRLVGAAVSNWSMWRSAFHRGSTSRESASGSTAFMKPNFTARYAPTSLRGTWTAVLRRGVLRQPWPASPPVPARRFVSAARCSCVSRSRWEANRLCRGNRVDHGFGEEMRQDGRDILLFDAGLSGSTSSCHQE